MINHSLSHGAVSLVSLIGAQTLADRIQNNFPTIHYWLASLSGWTIGKFDMSMSQAHLESALLVLTMGLIWGVLFWHLSEKRVYR